MPGRALTYFKGRWHEGNPKIAGPMTHAFWMSSVVFDGARAFEGVTPDLDLHCDRLIASARAMQLDPVITSGEVMELALDGVARFGEGAALYICPMFYAEDGFVDAYPETTQFVLTVQEAAMPEPSGATACFSGRRRPTPECAITDAKASCLYPNNGLAIREAKARGFKNAIMLDMLGHVAEFATANLFLAKDGALHTPAPNRTFLNGITRQRVIALLREDGVEVIERAIAPEEVLQADEVFSTGNYAKVLPFTRIEDRDLQPGPLYARARRLYWDYAHS
jgi:branched-chain amino acid aminotransferase